MTIKIKLDNMEKALEFVSLANNFTAGVDVKCGSIELDGKSIIGVTALGFPCELEVTLHSDNSEAIRLFIHQMDKYYTV